MRTFSGKLSNHSQTFGSKVKSAVETTAGIVSAAHTVFNTGKALAPYVARLGAMLAWCYVVITRAVIADPILV